MVKIICANVICGTSASVKLDALRKKKIARDSGKMRAQRRMVNENAKQDG